MVVLEGTTGSAPANDRATGWENILGVGPEVQDAGVADR